MSTMVTFAPSAANIDANSTPITPAPTNDRGGQMWSSCSIEAVAVEHRRVVEGDRGWGGCGRVPVTMTIFSAETPLFAWARDDKRVRIGKARAR